MLDGIAGKNDGIGLLPIDIGNCAPKAVTPQLSCRVTRFGHQYVRIADLDD